MSNCYPKPAVSAILIQDGKVLLVKRGKEPSKGLWSLPGGSVEPGETIQEAVCREVLEETSLVVEAGKVAGVYDVILRDGDRLLFHYVVINLFAKVISGEIIAGSDAADVRWVALDEIENYPTTEGLIDRLRTAGII